MKIFWAIAMAVGVLLLAGCGGQEDGAETAQAQRKYTEPPRDVTVTLDGHEGAENVGILMAQERGYFADAGLSVSIFEPVLPARPLQYVATRQDDFGVVQEPQLALAVVKDAPVIAVGSLVHSPTGALIWLKKSHIHGIADLKGKTIAIPGVPYQKDFLERSLAKYGLTLDDVTVKNVGYETIPALLSGRADAIFGSWNLEGAELESRGLKPVVTRFQKIGVPSYDEFVVITRSERVDKEPGLVRDFIAAVARGTAAAVEDPSAAAEAIEKAGLGGPKQGRKTTEAEVAATLPLLSKSAYMYSEEARLLVDWMHAEGIINEPPRPPMMLNNEFTLWQP